MISPHSKYQRFCSQVTSFKQTDAAGHQRLKKQRAHSHLWHFSQRVPFFFSPGCIALQSLHTHAHAHMFNKEEILGSNEAQAVSKVLKK